jgi:hypothetical protein
MFLHFLWAADTGRSLPGCVIGIAYYYYQKARHESSESKKRDGAGVAAVAVSIADRSRPSSLP